MARVVQKFGGTSVGDIERIRRVAERAARAHRAGDEVAVVVSAMGGETDRLLGLARQLTDAPHHREIDTLLASGEQVSIALVSLALQELGVPARSFLGGSAGVRTDGRHGVARIDAIDPEAVRAALGDGEVAVVAGFQGLGPDGAITTLGRGGSDLSAVAMAAALQADACEIYTDVDGIYTTDPRITDQARRIPRIGFEEMLELASLGAKVLQTRAVELAMKYGVRLHVRSTFLDDEGSWVVPDEEIDMEGAVVTGVAYDRKTARLSITGVPRGPGQLARLLAPLGEHGVNVDVIIQSDAPAESVDVNFTVSDTELGRAIELLRALPAPFDQCTIQSDPRVAKVSVVGAGMRSQAGVALKVFELLGQAGIPIHLVSTSEIKISCVIDDRFTELAVRLLHDGFELGDPPAV